MTRDDGLQLGSVLTRDTLSQDSHITKAIQLENSESPVVHLDIVPFGEDRSIITVHADGSLTVASADLLHTSSEMIHAANGTENVQLLAATILSLSDARKTTLKSRDDLSRDIPASSAILVAAFKKHTEDHTRTARNDLHYGAWSIPLLPGSLDLHQLFDHKLVLSSSESPRKQLDIIPSFGPRASTLILKSLYGIQRYDLTGLVPRQLPELRSNLLGHQDIIMVSNDLTLLAFQDSFRLLDPEYGVVRATLDLNGTLLRRKRKRSGSEAAGVAIDFICYFAQLRRVMIYSRSHLIACDLRLTGSGGNGTSASLLVNNIGRGRAKSHHLNAPLALDVEQNSKTVSTAREWTSLYESLDKLRQAGNAIGFETRVLKYLRKQSEPDSGGARPSRHSSSYLPESQIDYILSSLFSIAAATAGGVEQPQLRLDLAAPNLIRWLSKAATLSRQRLERALNSSYDSIKLKIAPGDIAHSLLRADPTCDMLFKYVKDNHGADPQEQAAIVRLLILKVLNGGDSTTQRLITEGEEVEIVESKVTAESDQEKERVLIILTNALAGLGLLDAKSISSVLRTSFSGGEILGLIQLLRQQLFKTGYPGSVLHTHDQTADIARGNFAQTNGAKDAGSTGLPIDGVLKILSACIDTVGPLDLLSRDESDTFLEDVIPDLLSEVSLATQAAEESANMHGTLRETLRYSQSDKPGRRHGKNRLEESLPPQQAGEIITLYTEKMEDEDVNGQEGVLPLGLHAEDGISQVKARKGGGQLLKRSLRHTLMLESRQRGAYSFERLVL